MISVAPVNASAPCTDPEKIAEDVINSYHEGASMVHLHVRDSHGKLTSDMTILEEIIRKIKAETDMVTEVSTGGVSDLSIQERCCPCFSPLVEAASLNVGSVNLGEAVYKNPIQDVRYCLEQIIQQEKRPEIEVFELGMIHTSRQLADRYDMVKPLLFALVFGHEGEMPATEDALKHMEQYLRQNFSEEEAVWGYTQANRRDWKMMERALELGASSLRIGFEDSDCLEPGIRAEKNAQLVRKAVSLLREKQMEPMTPAEVRDMMRIGR